MGAMETTSALSADQVLTTTRAVRRRLDFQRPVPKELLLDCLRVAIQAPTGSNRQAWQFLFISDPGKKREVAERYRRSWYEYNAGRRPDYPPGDPRLERLERLVSSAQYLADNMHRAPWLMIPLVEGRLPERSSTAEQAALWGSILPAFWSFLLAARARGLGTAYTTLHLRYEKEVAEILGIPYERYTQAGLTPIAHTLGGDFRPAPRLPLEAIVHWESW